VAPGGHVIENPLSGEQITIRATAAETGGNALEWELVLAPGGRVPSSHAHPEQEESFTVLAGRMRFRVGGRRVTAGPGDTVRMRTTIAEARRSRSKPDRGLVRTRGELLNQDDQPVLSLLAMNLLRAREAS